MLTAQSVTWNFPYFKWSWHFCMVSLNVPSRTCRPIFIEIGSYLTNTKQNISWHVFLDTVYMYSKQQSADRQFYEPLKVIFYQSLASYFGLSGLQACWHRVLAVHHTHLLITLPTDRLDVICERHCRCHSDLDNNCWSSCCGHQSIFTRRRLQCNREKPYLHCNNWQ